MKLLPFISLFKPFCLSKHSATYFWKFSENCSVSGKPTFPVAMLGIHFLFHTYDLWIWIEIYFLLPLCYTSSIVNRNGFSFTIWSYFKYSEMSSFLFRFKISNNEDIIVVLTKWGSSHSCLMKISDLIYPQLLTGCICNDCFLKG